MVSVSCACCRRALTNTADRHSGKGVTAMGAESAAVDKIIGFSPEAVRKNLCNCYETYLPPVPRE